ncbi:hypothetical protein CAter282_4499 [Collimonas arenae]|uniref:Uncharacterized protein n=1 Tax=Collimonas arenae TaxID=279058 RepID=A0A127PWQ7_9BURK|nr:hypothetical protein CAter10_4894 [Collimonas arenae]AMP12158.1 hypothetical protein CAter282_4499 [Collimonas arenae]
MFLPLLSVFQLCQKFTAASEPARQLFPGRLAATHFGGSPRCFALTVGA